MTDDELLNRLRREIERDIELSLGEDEQEHAERHWPDRIERQAAAFCRIIKRHRPVPKRNIEAMKCARCDKSWPCAEIRDLAAIYDIDLSPKQPAPSRPITTSAYAIGPVVSTSAFSWHPERTT